MYIMDHTKPKLMNRMCEGTASANDLSHFRVIELKTIAKNYGLSSSGLKNDLCQRIRDYLIRNPTQTQPEDVLQTQTTPKDVAPIQTTPKDAVTVQSTSKDAAISSNKTKKQPRKAYKDLEELLQMYHIKDLKSLIALPDETLESLIDIIQIHEGKVNLRDLLKNVSDPQEKIKIIVTEMAQKLCRCIKKIKGDYKESQQIAICISSIFHKKGITISSFQCDPVPMLIPKIGAKAMIRPRV